MYLYLWLRIPSPEIISIIFYSWFTTLVPVSFKTVEFESGCVVVNGPIVFECRNKGVAGKQEELVSKSRTSAAGCSRRKKIGICFADANRSSLFERALSYEGSSKD
jgi:hypothetical protein